mmetsp:Transcript_19069/g.28263  ORF Transcript_19069/g.28263 Transcript_19069/m.28263 type:complete len:599 (+) Transcript_19069:31-1827(+)
MNEPSAAVPHRADNQQDAIVPENLHPQNDAVVGGFQEVEDELTQLQLHIENKEWDAALERVRTHAEEIMPTRSQGGNGRSMTALHLACENGDCPIVLLKALLSASPRVAGMTDREGNTALHNACGGQFSYNADAISLLLVAYPQAALMQECVDQSTPLHLLLLLGGDVNASCVRLLLDVAYSKVAGLPLDYVPLEDFCGTDLVTSILIASNYPPSIIQKVRQIAVNDPLSFPNFLQPFIHLPAPTTIDASPQLLDDQASLLLVQECKKQTPLHSACARGLDTTIIELLANDSRYPGAHEAAKKRDHKDRCPIFYAGCYGVPWESVKTIYDLNPDAIHQYEAYNILPLDVTFISPNFSMEDRKLEIKRMRNDPSKPIDDFFVLQSAVPMWLTYETFLRLTYHKSYEDPPPGCSKWRVLHAAGSINSPPQFIRSAIKLHPWQLKEHDDEGYLPLHKTAMSSRPRGVDENQYWLNKGIAKKPIYFRLHPENRAKDNPVTIFVEAYPKGAQSLDKDYKLPLHWAIETGKKWDEGVESLVNAAPLSLSSRDMQYRLYPFMLAATINDLNLTFKLLILNPMMVRSGIFFEEHSLPPPITKKARS